MIKEITSLHTPREGDEKPMFKFANLFEKAKRVPMPIKQKQRSPEKD